ncbi:XdhC/CoxI family protein [Candidatus Thiothrix sp. Deng01]|uniref:XdhC/CoxI family protein n=1 Tax=Candidatus Thiothrix phosphatis TaxID=3112415 RepID=A0ABU6CXJ8_9GAMM|nr:XdhC/CoxI family protein [Candidatus Thiothrix sp. Deng01]MEB4591552.1 XdhC/CoxI family protein [Candidatus Thiothrix sp. Deng01]
MNTPIQREDILSTAQDWLTAGKQVALATVTHTWGSSPRPVGSQLAVADDGGFAGSVSGGCIEGEVIRAALAAITDGKPRSLAFGVSNEQAWEVGLACGGRVAVQVQSLADAAWIGALQAARAARREVALLTRLGDGAQALWANGHVEGGLALPAASAREVAERVAANHSGILAADPDLFLHVYAPPLRLLVVGAVHIAQALAPMAALAGFDVTLIDPRRAFATHERFPQAELRDDWPDEALEALRPDATTAVVTLSHDPKLDDPALIVALGTPAFYIGALGSKRTHAQRLQRLREEGFDDAALARIHAPIGLDLGGRLPAEVAVSILAQILQTRYQEGI